MMWPVREFDGSLLAIGLQIVPVGSASRYQVHVLKIFLVEAHVAMDVTPARRRTPRSHLVRVKSQYIRLDRQFGGAVHHDVERHVARIGAVNFREAQAVPLQAFAARAE